MLKKRIGISVYPEKVDLQATYQYLTIASNLGYDLVFVSFIHLLNPPQNDLEKVISSIKFAKKLNYYVIADFNYQVFTMLKLDLNNDLQKIKEMGIDCIRFDSPALAKEVADLTHNEYRIDIQLNMSNNDHFLDNVLDFQPIRNRLSGCHNFYPQPYTGLELPFFATANQKFKKHHLLIGAFIGSHHGKQGPAQINRELPTLEMSRNLDVITQSKILFYSNQIDFVLFGNAFASQEELISVARIERDEITFRIQKVKQLHLSEQKIIDWKKHFRRGDITKYSIRSTQTRVVFKEQQIPPNNIKKTFNRGDVVVVNENGGSYKGELHILLVDDFVPENNSYNYVGKVIDEEKVLLDYVQPWTHFHFE